MILQILILVALIRVLIMGLATGSTLNAVLIVSLPVLALSSLYFWLLDRTSGLVWWIIMTGGIVAPGLI